MNEEIENWSINVANVMPSITGIPQSENKITWEVYNDIEGYAIGYHRTGEKVTMMWDAMRGEPKHNWSTNER